MKRFKYLPTFIAAIILAVFVCGCGTEGAETQKRASASLTLVSKDGKEVSASNSSGTSGKPAGSTTSPSGGTTTSPGSTSATITGTPEVTETTTKNNYVITPVTEGLCEQLPASELGELAEYNVFNRLERNHLTEVMQEHKVCVDDVTGVVYYVNVGRDYFLYRIKDGKSELAVALPANYLYTHNGVVYFLLDAQNILYGELKPDIYKLGDYMYDKFAFEGMSEGDIYSYTPATGKVELVCPAQALRLKVTDEGIYYLKGELDKNKKKATGLEWYHLPFGSIEPEQVESSEATEVWNGYRFDLSGEEISLVSEDTGDIIEIEQSNSYARSCVFRDKVFSWGAPAIHKCFDLMSKEEIFSYNLAESIAATDWAPSGDSGLFYRRSGYYKMTLQKYIDEGKISSGKFALTDDSTLWFEVNMYIYSINVETGATQMYHCPNTEYNGKSNMGGGLSPATELYTDGSNLYVIRYNPFDKGEPKLMRLIFEYEEESSVWCWDVTDKIGVND